MRFTVDDLCAAAVRTRHESSIHCDGYIAGAAEGHGLVAGGLKAILGGALLVLDPIEAIIVILTRKGLHDNRRRLTDAARQRAEQEHSLAPLFLACTRHRTQAGRPDHSDAGKECLAWVRVQRRAHRCLEQLTKIIEEGYACRALQRSPHLVLLNVEWYHTAMRPVLARWMLLWLEANHISGLTSAQIEAYISGKPAPASGLLNISPAP